MIGDETCGFKWYLVFEERQVRNYNIAKTLYASTETGRRDQK